MSRDSSDSEELVSWLLTSRCATLPGLLEAVSAEAVGCAEDFL